MASGEDDDQGAGDVGDDAGREDDGQEMPAAGGKGPDDEDPDEPLGRRPSLRMPAGASSFDVLRYRPPPVISWSVVDTAMKAFKVSGGDAMFGDQIRRISTSVLASLGPTFPMPRLPLVAAWWNEVARETFRHLGPDFGRLRDRLFFPRNLWGLTIRREAMEALVKDGITVYAVPRTEIARALLEAPDTAARRAILGRRLPQIVDDCDDALDGFVAPELRETVLFIRRAIDAIRDGHTAPAQALLTTALEGLTWETYGRHGRNQYTSAKVTDEERLSWGVRATLVMGPISRCYEHFDPGTDAALIPRPFGRHRSAHRVSRMQYSKRNTAQVLLLVTAFCAYIDGGHHRLRI
ncbi:hypothetical protein ACQFYA_20990 [Promicromonospora sp. Marseille-Q5078]